MGQKGSKLSKDATAAVEDFATRIAPLGDITSKKMFGGYGVFESGKMFSLVNSDGEVFLKVVEANRPQFEAHEAKPHGRMPYYRIPEAVMADQDTLLEWVREAIALSKEA